MSAKNILEILQCPACNAGDLLLSPENNSLTCKNCSTIYNVTDTVPSFILKKDNAPPVASKIHINQGTTFNYIDHYQKDAAEYDYFAKRDNETEHLDRRIREYIASFINGATGNILDAGCGKAWVSQLFCPKGFNVISMDISFENTSRALKKYPFPNHSAVIADVYALPFKEKSFDYIVASEVIEHIVDPSDFVRCLFRVLKPGGILLVTTPYKEKPAYSLCIHCNKPTPFNAHLHSFDEHKLQSLYSAKDLKKFDYKTFGNKILIHFRMHHILKYFSFQLWKTFDKFINIVYNAPVRVLAKWEKS